MAIAITGSQLRELFPHALDGYVQAIAQGARFFDQYGVTTALRLAHFLAQCAAETDGFIITEESGNYSAQRLLEVFPRYFKPAQARAYAHKPALIFSRTYGGRMGNGGEITRDGWTYRGRGMIQLTGRENYARRSAIAGVDLVKDPDKAADCFVSLKIALQEWIDLGLNEWADKGPTHEAVLACARGINCGSPTKQEQPNGLDARREAFDKIWRAIGDEHHVTVSPAADGFLTEGETGAAVRDMQAKLASLGYYVGMIDGVFGPATKAAVATFQDTEKTGGSRGVWICGEYNVAAERAKPIEKSVRQAVNVTALANLGDAHIEHASKGKRLAGVGLALTAIGQGATMIDVNDLPNIAQGARAIVEPVLDTLRWGLGQNGFVVAGLGFAAIYILFHKAQAARVADVRDGKATP
jgi:putative chitinase